MMDSLASPLLLFLDVDGVLTMLDAPELPVQRVGGFHVRPIPLASALLRAIDHDPRIVPIWLTNWEAAANSWNEWAGIGHWHVASRMVGRPERHEARTLFPHISSPLLDWKLLAACYARHQIAPGSPAVWIEDGFATETLEWATQEGNIRLLDTTRGVLRQALLCHYADAEASARHFLEQLQG